MKTTIEGVILLVAIFIAGLVFGLNVGHDTYNIPIPPTADIACVPTSYEGDALDMQANYYEGVLNGVIAPTAPIQITMTNDPCQEDEVLWWTANDVRSCVNLDELCVDVEAYK